MSEADAIASLGKSECLRIFPENATPNTISNNKIFNILHTLCWAIAMKIQNGWANN